jgi:hypothetical protein
MPKEIQFPLHNAYSRFLYAFTLMFLPIEAVKKVWQRVPLEINGELYSGIKLFSYLWAGKNWIPNEYITRIWLELEDAFLSCGKYIREDFITFLKRGDVVEAGMVFRFLEPVLVKLFKFVDIRFGILKFIGTLHNTCNPNARCVTEGLSKDRNAIVIGYQILAMDSTFTHRFPSTDGDVAFNPLTQYMPLRFGATPFDKIDMVAECQTVFERIDPKLDPHIEKCIFYLGTERYGAVKRFKDFIKENGLLLNKVSPPDCDVVAIEKDYFCPVRKRTILYRGCAYGAPVWIMKVGYDSKANTPKDPLQSLKDELTTEVPSTYALLQPKHDSLISSFSEAVRFTYKTSEETLFSNDRFVTSGVQAKILREILLAHRDKKQCEFARREFIRNPEFVSDAYNTGFNTRLDRIIECMNKTCPEVKIEKHARGRFKIHPTCAIIFTEH